MKKIGKIGFSSRASTKTAGITLMAMLCLGLAAQESKAADGTISISGMVPFKGAFVHDPKETPPKAPYAYGEIRPIRVKKDEGEAQINIYSRLKDGNPAKAESTLDIVIYGELADFAKPPAKYPLNTSGDLGTARIMYNGTACEARSGTLTLKTFDPVDGVIEATMSGMTWATNGDCKKMGATGTLKVQRAVDISGFQRVP